jgi:hypothetical protein
VTVLVKEAKDAARRWVLAEASGTPGFTGAFFHGSTNWLADDVPLPATSDVDVMVVLDDPNPPLKPGKLIYDGVLLEVSYLARDQLRSPELVLGQYHLAGSFHTPSIILDPSGELTALQTAVSSDYAKRQWVYRRCQHARDKILGGFAMNESDPFPDQVVAWLFPAGITTHLLLVAGLENPTVRRRYMAVRELLASYGRLDFYEFLLELLGCARLSAARVEQHLGALTDAFDAAKAVIATPFFFAADISDIARPIAIDGSRELIARGEHREAIFWMVATYSRCQKVFHHDAPVAVGEQFAHGYHELLADLGIASFTDLQRRRDRVTQALPAVWEVAEAVMAANRAITE